MTWDNTQIMAHMKKLIFASRCQYKGCKDPATVIAYDRRTDQVDFFCGSHGTEVAEKTNPEYFEACPCCGCLFGVN